MSTQQLALWETATKDAAEELIPWTPDLIITCSTRWADGDTSPGSLDRLARVVLGDIESIMRNDGVKLFYRIISTSVIGDHVECACEYMCTADEFYGGKTRVVATDEEEEEE